MSFLEEIGEFGLIEKFKNWFIPQSSRVILGIEDDCAVVEGNCDRWYLLTCDSQVEDIHFVKKMIPPHLLGRRVLAVNLSDIAAMGGDPLWALLSLVLNPSLGEEWLNRFFQGVREEAKEFGLDIIGGNLARSFGPLVFDLTLIGEMDRGAPLLLRRNAQPGELIGVTGTLGDSAAGLKIVSSGKSKDMEIYSFLCNRYFCPTPRVKVGKAIRRLDLRGALIDISDGFIQDLGHILEESKVGATIEADRLPLSSDLKKWCFEKKCDPWNLALAGGEDFELIFTFPREREEEIKTYIWQVAGVEVTVVGEITSEKKLTIFQEGKEIKPSLRGWNHFRKEKER